MSKFKRKSYPKFGSARVLVTGANFHNFLNRVAQAGIRLSDVNRIDNANMSIKVPCNRLDKIMDMFKNSAFELRILRMSMAPSAASFLWNRLGLVVGALAVLVILLFLSRVCLGVVVATEDDAPEVSQKVRAALSEMHVGAGSLKDESRSSEVEGALLERVSELSLVNVSYRGCYLVVNFTLKKEPTPISPEVEGFVCATGEGVVSRVHVVSGTALIKTGDVVRPGQPVIAPYYLNAAGEEIPCEAKGSVYAYTWISATVEFPLVKIAYARTGNVECRQTLDILGQKVEIQAPPVNFKYYETEEVVRFIAPSGALPIKMIYTYYYETEQIEIEQDYEQNAEAVEFEARERAKAKLGDMEAIDEKCTVSEAGGVYFVTYYFKTEAEITNFASN